MAGPTPAQLVERHRRAQLAVRASFLTEFLAAWGLLRTDDLDRSYPAWIRIVMRLIRAFRQESARLAVDHYRELRRIGALDAEVDMPEVDFDLGNEVEHLAKVRRTHPEASVPARIIREERELRVPGRRARFTIKWDRADRAAQRGLLGAGPLNIKHRIGRGETPEQAARNAFVDASGAASRHVLNGGRATNLALVQNDQRAIGYVRVTDGNPCYFCAMLASRGIVRYGRGAKAFDESDARFIGQGQVKVHDHCGCSLVPVFAENASYLAQAKKYQDLWNEHIQNRYSGKDAINAWRRLIERPDLFKEKNQPTRRRRAA